MTLYEQESIESKLFRLKEITKTLEEARVYSKEKFLADKLIADSSMFNLMIGITIILDLGQHLLTRYAQRAAKEYKEVITMLGEEEIISREFAAANLDMAKFRNLMVHDYDKIDEALVYDYISKAPDVFRQFAKYYLDFVEKTKD